MKPQLLTLLIGEGQTINVLFYSRPADLADKTNRLGHLLVDMAGGNVVPLVLSSTLTDDGVAVVRRLLSEKIEDKLFDLLATDPLECLVFRKSGDDAQQLLDLH
jgi:hypothetical protein